MKKGKDRFFVLNRYPGKRYTNADAFECLTHEEATYEAFYLVQDMLHWGGDLDGDEVIVFIGSRAVLERAYPDDRIAYFDCRRT